MKELRKLINKEVKKALNENYRDPKENVAILYGMLKKGGKDAKYANDLIKDIKSELNIVINPTDPKTTLKLANQNSELAEYLDDAVENALDSGMARFKGMSGSMAGLRETAAKPHDMEKIEDFIMSAPEFESTSPTKLKKAVGEMYEEWKTVASNYQSIEEYFEEIEETGGLEAFLPENKNTMNKTKMIVKRLKEDTEYQEFFKKAMAKFKINTPADLKDPVRKKEFFDYVDKNYKAKDEMSENTYLMSNPETKSKVEMVINTLKDIDVDGETMEYILDKVGMSDQMASQLSDKVDDDGFPFMSGGRP